MYNYFYIHQRYKNISIKYQENGTYYYANRFFFLIGANRMRHSSWGLLIIQSPTIAGTCYIRGALTHEIHHILLRNDQCPAFCIFFLSLPFHLSFSLRTYLVTGPFVLSTPRYNIHGVWYSLDGLASSTSPLPPSNRAYLVWKFRSWARTCDGETCYTRAVVHVVHICSIRKMFMPMIDTSVFFWNFLIMHALHSRC